MYDFHFLSQITTHTTGKEGILSTTTDINITISMAGRTGKNHETA